MKTTLLLLAFVLAAIKPLRALDVQPERSSVETCYSIEIASAPATNVLSSTNAANGYQIGGSYNGNIREVLVQNDDASTNIFCSDSVDVSTTTTPFSSFRGFGIAGGSLGAAGTSQNFVLQPGQAWYCVNGSGTKETIATICAGR
ncbi:MAG: hypothetical protein KGL39_14470 [Patescibacteria group bacterium]|nr:hypothetical protein [Patescibacteria group bacterium]